MGYARDERQSQMPSIANEVVKNHLALHGLEGHRLDVSRTFEGSS